MFPSLAGGFHVCNMSRRDFHNFEPLFGNCSSLFCLDIFSVSTCKNICSLSKQAHCSSALYIGNMLCMQCAGYKLAHKRLLVDDKPYAWSSGKLEPLCLSICQHLPTVEFIVSITIKLVFFFQTTFTSKGLSFIWVVYSHGSRVTTSTLKVLSYPA
jgi:hypothetical protein